MICPQDRTCKKQSMHIIGKGFTPFFITMCCSCLCCIYRCGLSIHEGSAVRSPPSIPKIADNQICNLQLLKSSEGNWTCGRCWRAFWSMPTCCLCRFQSGCFANLSTHPPPNKCCFQFLEWNKKQLLCHMSHSEALVTFERFCMRIREKDAHSKFLHCSTCSFTWTLSE